MSWESDLGHHGFMMEIGEMSRDTILQPICQNYEYNTLLVCQCLAPAKAYNHGGTSTLLMSRVEETKALLSLPRSPFQRERQPQIASIATSLPRVYSYSDFYIFIFNSYVNVVDSMSTFKSLFSCKVSYSPVKNARTPKKT